MEPASWILLVGLGVWAALDGVSAGQFMVSRPLVTGTLSGWILGDPWTGFILGFFLEILHLPGIPVGGVRLPEPGPATVPAAAAAILLPGPGSLALGAGLGIVLAQVGGWTVVAQRRWQGALLAHHSPFSKDPRRLTWVLLGALALDGLRGLGLVLPALGLVLLLPPSLAQAWPLSMGETLALLAVLASAPAGALLAALPAPRYRWALLGVGLVMGGLLSIWTGVG